MLWLKLILIIIGIICFISGVYDCGYVAGLKHGLDVLKSLKEGETGGDEESAMEGGQE